MNVKANPIWLALVLCFAWFFLYSSGNAEVIELEGKVKAVDANARTVTIERRTAKGTKTLDLEVSKKSKLSGIQVGEKVRVSYDPDVEVVVRVFRNSVEADEESRGMPQPSQDLDALVREVLELIESVSATAEVDALRRSVAVLYAKQRNYEGANKLVSAISEAAGRDVAALSLARHMAAAGDFDIAEATARNITERTLRIEALIGVIREEANSSDKQRCHRLVEAVSRDADKVPNNAVTLVRIAEVASDLGQKKRLFADALQSAKQVTDKTARDARLQIVLEGYLRINELSIARDITPLISEGQRRWGYENVAREHYRHKKNSSADELVREAWGIDWRKHIWAERAIAKAGSGDLSRVKRDALQQEDPWDKFLALVALGEAYAARHSGEDACECLKQSSSMTNQFQGNQRLAAEGKAFQLANAMIAKGLDDEGIGIRLARQSSGQSRATRMFELCNAYAEGGDFAQAHRLIEREDLGPLQANAIYTVAKADAQKAGANTVPHWVDSLEQPFQKAFAYLGVCDALLEVTRSSQESD